MTFGILFKINKIKYTKNTQIESPINNNSNKTFQFMGEFMFVQTKNNTDTYSIKQQNTNAKKVFKLILNDNNGINIYMHIYLVNTQQK